MNEKLKQHAPAAALTGVQIGAPLNPHGQCFGLIPAGGDWLDDLIDWSRRQFKRPEDAQRIAASWNAMVHVPLAQLLDPAPLRSVAVKLSAALAKCNAASELATTDPTGFAGAVVALNAALRALKTELAGEFHEYADEKDEEMQAPVQFAVQKIADAMLLLYGVGADAAPLAVIVREPYARRGTAAPCEHDWPTGEGGTDLDGTCTKCGMAFQYMIHMQMP
ncbi:MAG: hypothetical protein M3Y65_16625 [Pseudomonadota bacterium]|nr:hypothetical protein [Pseudomonadota bacterium]